MASKSRSKKTTPPSPTPKTKQSRKIKLSHFLSLSRLRLPHPQLHLPHLQRKHIIIISILIATLLFTIGFILFKDVPNPTSLSKRPAPVSTQILDRHGQLLYEIYTDQNRTPVSIKDLPDHLTQATISIEDKNFYSHHGLDLRGIARAAFKTLTGQRLEGGSTITQQLVKTALLNDPSRTISRKIKEAALAILTEIIYSKDQILEMYLNNVPYGGTAYGIETAARQYFNKSAKDLTLAEATLLAGLPQAPTRYSPFGAHPELAKQRQEQVLRRLHEDGYITSEELETAKNESLNYASVKSTIKAPHFVLWIKDLLVDRYGEDLVNLGGLRVTTTLDLNLQEYAQASLSAEVDKLERLKVGNGAALVTKPKTGEVLAMIGSRDYFDKEHDGAVNITLRYRQPGSSIKPLNYAVGLLKGWPTSTMYLDIPTCFTQSGQKAYCPKNYDNTWHGPTQMRFALGNSYNIPAVKQLALNGLDAMIATASAMGITGWDNPDRFGLSLTLGGGEVRMIDMAVAFGVFANSGVKVPLNPILKVETYTGQVLEETNLETIADLASTSPLNWDDFWSKPRSSNNPTTQTTSVDLGITSPYSSFLDRLLGKKPGNQTLNITIPETQVTTVLPEEVAYIISHILLDNNARVGAFGSSSELVIPGHTVSVKTGTTNDLRDNWTIGFTPDYLVTTWVGNNDNTSMSYVASGVTGASPIWNDIMRFVLKDEKDRFPTRPQGIVDAQVCTLTGLLASPDAPCDTRNEIFIKDHLPLPSTTLPTRKQIWIRRDTNQPLLPGEEVIDLNLEEHTVVSDPFTQEFCLDCAYPQETKPNPDNPDEQIPTGKISYPTFSINYDLFKAKNITPTSWINTTQPPIN
jgi:membrane peptidoglycan carboxypeptidase